MGDTTMSKLRDIHLLSDVYDTVSEAFPAYEPF